MAARTATDAKIAVIHHSQSPSRNKTFHYNIGLSSCSNFITNVAPSFCVLQRPHFLSQPPPPSLPSPSTPLPSGRDLSVCSPGRGRCGEIWISTPIIRPVRLPSASRHVALGRHDLQGESDVCIISSPTTAHTHPGTGHRRAQDSFRGLHASLDTR